jgi:hypothetical protein
VDEQQARQLLGVDTGPVSLPDLREARNNALKAHHPDKVGSDPAAVRRSTYWTAQINVAYELLEPLAEGGKPINPTSADRNGPQRQSFAAAARRAQERVAAQERAAAMAGRRSSAQSNSRPQYRAAPAIIATALVAVVALALVLMSTGGLAFGGITSGPTPRTHPDCAAIPIQSPHLGPLRDNPNWDPMPPPSPNSAWDMVDKNGEMPCLWPGQ